MSALNILELFCALCKAVKRFPQLHYIDISLNKWGWYIAKLVKAFRGHFWKIYMEILQSCISHKDLKISSHFQHNCMNPFIERQPVSSSHNSRRQWLNIEKKFKQLISPCSSSYITNTCHECKVKSVQYVGTSIRKNFIPSISLPISSHPLLTQSATQRYQPQNAVTCTAVVYCYLLIYFLTNYIFDVRNIYCYFWKFFEFVF